MQKEPKLFLFLFICLVFVLSCFANSLPSTLAVDVLFCLLLSRHLKKKKSLFSECLQNSTRRPESLCSWNRLLRHICCMMFPRDERVCGLQVVPTRRICPCKPRLTGANMHDANARCNNSWDVRMFGDRTCECRADVIKHTLTWCNAREKWRTDCMRIN